MRSEALMRSGPVPARREVGGRAARPAMRMSAEGQLRSERRSASPGLRLSESIRVYPSLSESIRVRGPPGVQWVRGSGECRRERRPAKRMRAYVRALARRRPAPQRLALGHRSRVRATRRSRFRAPRAVRLPARFRRLLGRVCCNARRCQGRRLSRLAVGFPHRARSPPPPSSRVSLRSNPS